MWVVTQGWKVVAVDFSAVGLQKAAELAKRAGDEFDLVVADAADHQPGPPFDLVVLYLHLPAELSSGGSSIATPRQLSRPAGPCWSSATAPPTRPTVSEVPRIRKCSSARRTSSAISSTPVSSSSGPSGCRVP